MTKEMTKDNQLYTNNNMRNIVDIQSVISELEDKIEIWVNERSCARESGYINYCHDTLEYLQGGKNALKWVLNQSDKIY